MSATAAIQTAIYAVLAADATLPTLSLTVSPSTGTLTTVGVFNDVPEGRDYPHVLITKAAEDGWYTFGSATTGLGYRNIIRVHVYSRYQGDMEAYGIHSRIVALLNFQPLTVSGYSSALVKYDGHRLLVEDIEKMETRHLVGEFYVWVKQ